MNCHVIQKSNSILPLPVANVLLYSNRFAKKEKSVLQEVYASDLQLPTISGHLMDVRTNKRRWCVLKDQHLYIFKSQEEPALLQIALPGCDISTVPRNDKTKVSDTRCHMHQAVSIAKRRNFICDKLGCFHSICI